MNIRGTPGNDHLLGTAFDDVLNSDGSVGADLMEGLGGNDTYVVNSIDDRVVEAVGGGIDTVLASVGVTLAVNVENLTLISAAGAANGSGNASNNFMIGNEFANVLVGLDGNDRLYGLAGNDRLEGGNGNDYLHGGAGQDLLFGGLGHDALVGDSGGDLLNGGAGADRMTGGSGDDVYHVDAADDLVVEAADGGVDWVVASLSETLDDNVEKLSLSYLPGAVDGTGNSLANTISGNHLANTLRGLLGNDSLWGGSGNDRLIGDDGNDTLDGSSGADALLGGAGSDVYFVDAAGDVVSELASSGIDQVNATVSATLADNVEDLALLAVATALDGTGNALANRIVGNACDNKLSGLDGHDRLWGGGGNDNLIGGAGDDRLYGDAGQDTVNGGLGSDLLYGGLGSDFLVGNLGADRLDGGLGRDVLTGDIPDFEAGADNFVFSAVGAANADLITDFMHADDTVVLSNGLDAGLAGALSVGIKGLGFDDHASPFGGAPSPGDPLAASCLFHGSANGGGPSGIYIDLTSGAIGYDPTSGVAGDGLLLGWVSPLAAAALDASDFVFGS